MRCEKDLKDNKDNSLHLGRKYTRKTVRSSEQIMATDKYPSLYNNQINARALIGQSAVGCCAGKPTEKSRVYKSNRLQVSRGL